MVHEHRLYYMDGHDPTHTTIRILVSPVYDTVYNIWLGGLDTWLNRYGGQLCPNHNNRLNSIREDDWIMALPRGMNKYWATTNGHEFELLSVYTPFE